MPKSLGQLNFKNKKKVVVAMSGGIDSSVAAALLKRAGFNLIGVFMKFWMAPEKNSLIGGWNRCCSPEAEKRARMVAKILGIPFYVFNFEKEFKKKIVDYFLQEYEAGRTPNPCVACNKEIKFGLLLEKALGLDADYVATGHYARKIQNQKSKIQKILRAKDKEKDQSYFLWQLDQKQLKHILFPIGDYTKGQVRVLARKFKLPVLNIPESMEICFIPDKLEDFLARHIKLKPGSITRAQRRVEKNKYSSTLAFEGEKTGHHRGLPFYTIGQRKGIGLPGGPYYVLDKNLKKNLLVVTKDEKDLLKKELVVKNINWISGKEPKLPADVQAKIRYRSAPAKAEIVSRLRPKVYSLRFKAPQRAVTPGQSVVFYGGQGLVGGGIVYS